MNQKTITDINKKIEDGEANVFTASEFKNLIRAGDAPEFEEVDVVTCGTCGVMSGTAAIFNLIASEAGAFKRAKNIYLNGVQANVGPCPNEWLGSVDGIINGTSHSKSDSKYGGGFLFKDLISGKDISIEVEDIEGNIIESSTNLSEMPTAQLLGTRNAFKNYIAFVNPSKDPVSSIFNGIPLKGGLDIITFSGCGDINPLQNDPNRLVLKTGSKVLLNGAEGLLIGEGTRSSKEKPNLMLTADMHQMNKDFIGGFVTGEGPEVFDSVAIPIPVLNEEIYNNLLILNEDISLTVSDIAGRHMPLTETNYGVMWDNHDDRPVLNKDKCLYCDQCIVQEQCPTKAIHRTTTSVKLDLNSCFGCGLCAYYCVGNAFSINTGSTTLNIDSKDYKVDIACRQSDKLRAKNISAELKEKIVNNEFKL